MTPGPGDGGVPEEDGPPVMWPTSDSGFEADPFSPAGTAEREWAFARGLGRRRGGRMAVWGVLLVVPLVLLVYAVTLALRHH